MVVRGSPGCVLRIAFGLCIAYCVLRIARDVLLRKKNLKWLGQTME
jgi:hypothetical protein